MRDSASQSMPEPPAGPRTLIRVLCVDDAPDVAQIVCRLIDSEPGMQCIGCLDSADGLVDEIRGGNVDVVLLDATMPGKPPLTALREIAAEFPTVKTVILSGHDDPGFIESAMDAGAWGFVSKDHDPATMLLAIRQVAGGNLWFPKSDRRV